MQNTLYKLCLAPILVVTGWLLVLPSPVKADGGPILKDPELWALLEEAQQTAVVTLKNNNTVDVDLFVSLLDSTGQSHEIVFFVPLGKEPTDFNVIEQTSVDFDQELTRELDEALREEARLKRNMRLSLLPGTLLINGGWMLPLAFPLLLTGCAGEEAPEATYETESSRVDIYGLNEDTDLEALINTTGLDPSVQDTLSRLRGQRIAIVTLQTQPPLPEGDSQYRPPSGQPGIHLAWTTALVTQSARAAYSYPLGTGASWAHPIELTRVYVVAPPGIDFTVQYPRLGTNYSGFARTLFYPLMPRITEHYDIPAYAVDEARGDFGHIWLATYAQSNSAEDIVIVAVPSGGFVNVVRRVLAGSGMIVPTGLIGVLLAVALWVVAWRYCMPRLLPLEYRWGGSRLWRDSLIYPALNVVIVAVVAFVAIVLLPLAAWNSAVAIAGLVVAGLVVLVPGVVVFIWRHAFDLGVSNWRAFAAYILVALVTNAAYLALAFGYAALIGVI